MEFKLKQPYKLDPVNGVEIEDEVVRARWSKDNKSFSRNTFVTIRVKGGKNRIYRILKGVSTEEIKSSEVLVSYSAFKQLNAKKMLLWKLISRVVGKEMYCSISIIPTLGSAIK